MISFSFQSSKWAKFCLYTVSPWPRETYFLQGVQNNCWDCFVFTEWGEGGGGTGFTWAAVHACCSHQNSVIAQDIPKHLSFFLQRISYTLHIRTCTYRYRGYINETVIRAFLKCKNEVGFKIKEQWRVPSVCTAVLKEMKIHWYCLWLPCSRCEWVWRTKDHEEKQFLSYCLSLFFFSSFKTWLEWGFVNAIHIGVEPKSRRSH